MTTKKRKTKDTKAETQVYQPEEVQEMLKKGYITAHAAAAEHGVRVDRVYRAIKAKRVRVILSKNGWNRYVHRGDFTKLIEAQRAKVMETLGIDQ